jgi:hypothetical protein
VVIEVLPALFQKRDDTAVGPGSAQQRQHCEQQQIRQRIPFALLIKVPAIDSGFSLPR